MLQHQRIIGNTLILVSLSGIIWPLWVLYSTAHPTIDPWLVPLGIGGATALGLALSLFLDFKSKPSIAVIAFSTILAAYAGNFVLELTGRNLLHIFDAKIVRHLKVAAPVAGSPAIRPRSFISPRPPSNVNPNDLYRALHAHGIDADYMYSSPQLLPVIANKSIPEFLPLSSKSNTVTIMCNEGDQREFPIIRTDRYGFNNDDAIHAMPGAKILIVGDSFAQGSCVHQEQSVAGVLRRNGYPAISAGIGGFGPIQTLAALKEYGETIKPRTVLWFYFDGNDVVDLQKKGLRSRFALQYLKDDFSQNLINRQAEVDAFWNNRIFDPGLAAFAKSKAQQETWKAALSENLPLVRELTGLPDLASLSDDESLYRVFSHIISTAKRRVGAWGGKLYFVVIPNKDDYEDKVAKHRLPIMSRVEKLGVPIIDVDAAIRTAGDPLDFYPVRNDWGHFNPAGYRVFAEQVMTTLENDFEASPPAAEPAQSPAVAAPETPVVEPAPSQEPAPNPEPASPPEPVKFDPTGDVQLRYESYGKTSSVIPTDATQARGTDGASILGYRYVPSATSGTLEVTVTANAYATDDNELVVGIFLSGQDRPLKLARVNLAGGERGSLETTVHIPFSAQKPMTFDIRVGPARPGTIYINGNEEGRQNVPTLPRLSISETDQAAEASPAGQPDSTGATPVTTQKAIPLLAPQQTGGMWRQQFSGPAETGSVMATRLSALDAAQGLKVLGFDAKPVSRSGKLRVRIAINAISQADNELVIGLFRGDGTVPAGLATATLPAGRTTYLIKSFDLEDVDSTESLSVRAGPGRPGSIHINGDGKGGRQQTAFYPVLTAVDPATATTPPFPDDDGSYDYAGRLNLLQPNSDPSPAGRTKIDCDAAFDGDRTGVFVIFGQSQAANSGSVKYESRRDVVNFNFLDSGCYKAIDPLLGASNLNGSLWTRMGDRLVDSGAFDRVVVAPIAVGGTFLSEWMPGDRRHRRLSLTLQRLRDAGANITGFLWQQGEAEANLTDMSAAEYKSGFLEMLASIRAQGFSAPVYVAVSTYCGAGVKRNTGNIRRALQELAIEYADIFPGPDTDVIGPDQRHDDCHFDGTGQDRAAGMWAESMHAR